MKNKNIYILLPAVLLIWGLLGYKVFTAVGPKNTPKPTPVASNFTPKEITEAEPFTVNLDYRDPFLGSTTKPKTVKPKKRVKKPTKPFPKISFKGVVSSKTGQVFLISVNGKQHFFKKNKTFNGVKLIRGNTKEVVLVFEGERKSFVLAK